MAVRNVESQGNRITSKFYVYFHHKMFCTTIFKMPAIYRNFQSVKIYPTCGFTCRGQWRAYGSFLTFQNSWQKSSLSDCNHIQFLGLNEDPESISGINVLTWVNFCEGGGGWHLCQFPSTAIACQSSFSRLKCSLRFPVTL